MEDESFELLSSMSPNVKHCQKHFRKGTTVLALRKSLQKSSLYDKSIHTTKNEELIVTEISSTSTSQSSNSKSSKSCEKLLNTTPISIHDSDSENELKLTSNKSISPELQKSEKISDRKVKRNFLLPQDKFETIKHWVDSVNLLSQVRNISTVSAYSELSTIYGEESGGNFITERTGRAINSTGIEAAPVHFDKLFNKKTDIPLSSSKDITDIDEALIINESYIKEDTSLLKSTQGNKSGTLSNGVSTIDETNLISNYEKSVISSSSTELVQKKSVNSVYKRNTNNSNEKVEISESDEGIANDSDNSFSLNENLNKKLQKSRESSRGFSHKTHFNNVHKGNINEDGIQVEVSTSDEDIVKDSDNSFSLNESLNTRLKSKNKNISTGKSQISYNSSRDKYSENKLENDAESVNEQEVASMLDDLYGHKWREKEEHVLFKTPKTEPRKQVPKLNKVCITNSEQKPKLSVLYKNPYLETEKTKSYNLLITLQKSRLKHNVESPAVKRLNDLCDSSDTDSNSDAHIKPRTKLNFNDSDSEDETTSKYFKDTVAVNKKLVSETESKKEQDYDKENFNNFSFLGQSLEERIRRKVNGIRDVSGGKKNEKKNVNDKTPLKERCDTKSNRKDKKIDNSTKKGEIKTDNRKLFSTSISSDDTWEEEISKIVHESKPINGKYSFLASLSANIPILQCDMSARIYRNNFRLYKEQLLMKLFKLYNEKVFENAIPQDTALEWNDRMRGTAGFCYCKKITRRTGAVERTARIVLSTKVIDAAYRLRDTLIHEMCHAATWIVNCVSDGHGPYWKSWACKAMQTFPELPPIKRCHDYVINTKYTYKCTSCGYSIGRHSKSLDIERKRCGYCLGKFEVLLNKISKKGETKSVPATPKKEATGFALFVKENYSAYKQTSLKHGEVMKLLGQKFQEMKLKAS